MLAASKPLTKDVVYEAETGGEYRNAHVQIIILNDSAEIIVTPSVTITAGELEKVLRVIESDMLNKARLSLCEECRVLLRQGGETYNVTVADCSPVIISAIAEADR